MLSVACSANAKEVHAGSLFKLKDTGLATTTRAHTMILRRPHLHISNYTLFKDARPVRALLVSHEGRRRRRPPLVSQDFGKYTHSYSSSLSTAAGASHAIGDSRVHTPASENDRDDELSFKRIFLSSNYQVRRDGRNTYLHELSRQVAFLFSDLNLRNNEHARSIFRDDRFLPLKDLLAIKSVKKYTRDAVDPSCVVIDAINFFNANNATSSLGQSSLQLHVEESNSGDTVVRRSPSFCYVDSIKNSRGKMMVVEGWPTDKKARPPRAISHVRSLICNRDVSDIPMAYFRYDNDLGVMNIEFESEEGASCAWENLRRAASHADVIHGINVQNLLSDTHSNSYRLQLGQLILVTRSIDISMTSSLDPDGITDDTAAAVTVSDDKQSNPVLDKPVRASILPTLNQFTDAMTLLYQEHVSLPSLSPELLRKRRHRTTQNNKQHNTAEEDERFLLRRQYLCRDVARLVSSIKASINQGKIRALRGKDGYALTDSLGLAMLVYSETQPHLGAQSPDGGLSGDALSPYEACLDVFGILRKLNLDIQPSHYAYAIRAACHESLFLEATKLFLGQIDGNDTDNPDSMAAGGFTPIDATLAWEGLYAMAMTEEEGGDKVNESPSKRVFDTAMKMCMISPSGQKSYILAAGTALGRAGLWMDCVDFATRPNSILTYGSSIASAAMLACIECSRYAEAIDAYDVFMSGNRSVASEYQWGGGDITAVKPLCRDLALHAMGGVEKGGLSQDAVLLFREIIHEGHPVSSNALLGLAHSMEFDGAWQSSVNFMKTFIDLVYHKESASLQIVSELSINANDEDGINPMEQNNLLANILASVMRVCNSEGQHGLAMLVCSIANNSYTSQQKMKMKMHDLAKRSAIVKAAASQKIISENHHILEAFIQSLDGLGCGDYADELSNELHNDRYLPRLRQNESAHAESWINAYFAIDRVLKAMDAIRSEGNISAESRLLFERGLSRAMDHCTDSSQSAAALELFVHASAILVKKDDSLTGKLRTFFGMEGSYSERKDSDGMLQHAKINLKIIGGLSDPLLAAIVKTYSKLGQSQNARSAFDDGTMHSDDSTLMTQSNNNALEAILDVDIDEGLIFFDAMDAKCVNPSTFIVVARRCAQNGTWPEIGEVYNRARGAGCISEELGLIAMQAVCESELLKGKITILRKIVDDVSGLVLMKGNDWIKSRYWTIRKNVGFHYARLLMRWNDPATSKKEELLFAVNEMRQAASEGIVVKNDPLMCIVSIAEVYGTDGRTKNGDHLSESQRRSTVNLILEACREARRSGFIENHAFTAKAARGLRALNANKECVQFVNTLISGCGKSRHRIAMEEAIYAASKEGDHVSLQLITDVFEKSGYDSIHLLISV